MSSSDVAPANWYERSVLKADVLVAALCTFLLGVLSVVAVGDSRGYTPLVLLPIVMTGVLVLRRSKPMWFVGAVAAIAVLEVLVADPPWPAFSDAVVLIAIHTAARYCPRWFGRAALAVALVGTGWATYRWTFVDGNPGGFNQMVAQWASLAFVGVLCLVGSYALGRAQLAKVRAIGVQLAGLAERNDLLQHEHEQQLKLATEQERGRIAAETHDILAHSLAIIVAQADGAAMVVGKNPARAQQAIEQIADTSREALDEVRQKVAALRRGEDPTSDLAPAKSLANLPALVENVVRAGLPVELHTDGDIAAVPAGLSLSAYRIVQEALTNALKHGGPKARAAVKVKRVEHGLRISVEDDGRGVVDSDGSGSGLNGMRARVEQYDGVLAAGPRVGGGFQVHAMMPLPATRMEQR